MPARTVITRFGGIRPLASALGHRSHTTVQGWWDRDIIPAQRQRELLDLAARSNVLVSAADLIPDAVALCGRCETRADDPHVDTCTSAHCPMRVREAEAA